MTHTVPVVFISDDDFIMPTCVAVTSLLANRHPDTEYLVTIIMAECNTSSEEKIRRLEGRGAVIRLLHASLEEYRDIKQMQHVPVSCLLKFDLCDFIKDFDKILYLDGDVIVREDLHTLYETEIGDHYAAAVRDLESVKEDHGNINAGVMLYNTGKIRKERLNEEMKAIRRSLGDRASMDQQAFNIATKKDYLYLDPRYNCVPGKILDQQDIYTIEEINRVYGTSYSSNRELYETAAIYHYATSNKPWKYTFMSWAKDWYAYYPQSPFGDEKLVMRGKWGYRFHEMKKALQKEGLSGVMGRLRARRERKKDDAPQETWE